MKFKIGDVEFTVVPRAQDARPSALLIRYAHVDELKTWPIVDRMVRGRTEFWQAARELTATLFPRGAAEPQIVTDARVHVPVAAWDRVHGALLYATTRLLSAISPYRPLMKPGRVLRGKLMPDEIQVYKEYRVFMDKAYELLDPYVDGPDLAAILNKYVLPSAQSGEFRKRVVRGLEAMQAFGLDDFFAVKVIRLDKGLWNLLSREIFLWRTISRIVFRFPLETDTRETPTWVVFAPALFRVIRAIQARSPVPGEPAVVARLPELFGLIHRPTVEVEFLDKTRDAAIEAVADAGMIEPLSVRIRTRFSVSNRHLSALELALSTVHKAIPEPREIVRGRPQRWTAKYALPFGESMKLYWQNLELVFRAVYGRPRKFGPGYDIFQPDDVDSSEFNRLLVGLDDLRSQAEQLYSITGGPRQILKDYSFVIDQALSTIADLRGFASELAGLYKRRARKPR